MPPTPTARPTESSAASPTAAHILQGMEDPDVPWQHALRLVEHLPGDSVSLTLIKDGDHRLSRPEDLDKLIAAVEDNRKALLKLLREAKRPALPAPVVIDAEPVDSDADLLE